SSRPRPSCPAAHNRRIPGPRRNGRPPSRQGRDRARGRSPQGAVCRSWIAAQAFTDSKSRSPPAGIARKRPRPPSAAPRAGRRQSVEIDVEDRHREIVGQLAVVVVLEDDAEELLTEIDLARIVLARACLDLKLRVLERALEVGVEFPDFVGFQTCSPGGWMIGGRMWHGGRRAVKPARALPAAAL